LPHLGEVRGKIVLLRRFAATGVPLGIDATAWPDNQPAFSIDDADAKLRIEDFYDLTDNDAKWAAITSLLGEAAAGDPSTWMLTYTSGFQTVMALPSIPTVADDINARLDDLLDQPATAHAHLGTVVMDFVTASRVAKVADTNVR
jgi:1-phosphatidylinositol phosphodiesterase